MEQYKSKHYKFTFDPAMVQPVRIENNDGKAFYVMANELIEFMASLARKAQSEALTKETDRQILGLE